MNENPKKLSAVDQAADDLFNFAVEREDVKWLLAQLPEDGAVKPTTVEYELQLLKIISVGWSLSFFLEGTPRRKAQLAEKYWTAVNEFSKGLSETTGLMIGQDIDYFEIVKQRLDMYVAIMTEAAEGTDPVTVIGPAFAKACGDAENIFAALAGSKMFNGAGQRVRQYLEAVKLR